MDIRSIEHVSPQAQTPAAPHRRVIRGLTGWRLWTVPRWLIAYLFLVDAVGVTLTVVWAGRTTVDRLQLETFAVLAVLGLATAEITRHVERLRRRFADTPHVNMSSVWTLSAALLLPPILAAATAVTLYLHLWLRSWYRIRGVHPYRLAFNASAVVLASYGAAATMTAIAPNALSTPGDLASLAALGAAVCVYSIVNTGLVAIAIGLFERRLAPGRMLGSVRENAVEYATLGLGLTTAALCVVQPVLVLAQLPALMLLHRCVLVRQVEEAASTDHKTGLRNATAWTSHATAELARAARDNATLGILMIDLDHFTRINTTHGHHTGDQVLRHVAGILRHHIRPYDILGRLAAEEFVILCPDITAQDLIAIAERLRTAIHSTRVPADSDRPDLTVTASIGAAFYPDAGPTLDDLLRAADVALYAAKDAGRNRVQTIVNNLDTLQPDPS